MSKKITRFNMKIDRQNVLTIPVEDNDGGWVMYKDIKELIELSCSIHSVITRLENMRGDYKLAVAELQYDYDNEGDFKKRKSISKEKLAAQLVYGQLSEILESI
jgi:uncharacterized protein YeeX (DUF496 family)